MSMTSKQKGIFRVEQPLCAVQHHKSYMFGASVMLEAIPLGISNIYGSHTQRDYGIGKSFVNRLLPVVITIDT